MIFKYISVVFYKDCSVLYLLLQYNKCNLEINGNKKKLHWLLIKGVLFFNLFFYYCTLPAIYISLIVGLSTPPVFSKVTANITEVSALPRFITFF